MPMAMSPAKKRIKNSKKAAADSTEQIVQMIAQSIASLPVKERHAAMDAFNLTAEAISAREAKAAKPRKRPASRPSRSRRTRS